MSKNNVYEGFVQALFFSGAVSLPRFLLDNYSYLGITNQEMMLIIHLLNEITDDKNPERIDEHIAARMGITLSELQVLLQSLQQKGFLAVNPQPQQITAQNNCIYDLSGLIDQLFEIWGINQFKQLESVTKKNEESLVLNPKNPSYLKLIATFEQELGRPLTGFECEHIQKWLLASYGEELIIEALRRGVSAGIRSFRYLDSILREWEKKGIKTLLEIEAEDKYFQERQENKRTKSNKSVKRAKNKYDDIYL
ncbi:MAG TPA: DnaD domain protein [Peptococcaceae bacterium]|nr:DnaD domain protein [Peptococcaceae bacterium]